MKNVYFWILLGIIVIQTFFFSYKIFSIEKQNSDLQQYITNIDNNVATIDGRLLDMTYKVNTLYDKSYGLN